MNRGRLAKHRRFRSSSPARHPRAHQICAIVVAATLAFLTATSCSTQAPKLQGQTTVSKWKGGKRSAYLLSFDDNLPSQLVNVIPELNRRKIHGTFYVVPGSPFWTIDEAKWTQAAQSPYVTLANHTFTHTGVTALADLDVELSLANEAIARLYPGRRLPYLMGFAQPGGVPWNVTPQEQAGALVQHDLVERPPFRGSPGNYSTREELLASVDQALATGGMGHNDMHGVGGDYLETPVEWFTALLTELETAADLIWVTDIVSYVQYVTERDSAKIDVVSDADEIDVTITCSVDPALYDYPLTLTTQVPANWKSATVSQAEKKVQVEVRDGVVMYDAVPGAGDIELMRN